MNKHNTRPERQADKPMFAVVDYVSVRGEVNVSRHSRGSVEMRSVGQLRQDGTYTSITGYDYVSWMHPQMTPRRFWPKGFSANKEIIELLVERLNELFAEKEWPTVPAMQAVVRGVYREVLDKAGFNRFRKNGEWFGEPRPVEE